MLACMQKCVRALRAHPSLEHQALMESQFTSTPSASIVCLFAHSL